jgi:hypothetical protein
MDKAYLAALSKEVERRLGEYNRACESQLAKKLRPSRNNDDDEMLFGGAELDWAPQVYFYFLAALSKEVERRLGEHNRARESQLAKKLRQFRNNEMPFDGAELDLVPQVHFYLRDGSCVCGAIN